MLKKSMRIVVSTAITLLLASGMFVCFIGGAPETGEELNRYVCMAAIFSLALSAFVSACANYILYLQNKVEKLEEKVKKLEKKGEGR